MSTTNAEVDIEMRFEPAEASLELFEEGLTLWGAPLLDYKTKFAAGLRDILALEWYMWPPTVGVRQISLSTDPAPAGTSPPEAVWARVTIFGLGFEPGVPVKTKWNNAFGFPDNGAGPNSIQLQTPTPDASGRFAFKVIHKAVKRAAKDWYWEANNQLVLVAQQPQAGTPVLREASQRYVPPHVLWQWVP